MYTLSDIFKGNYPVTQPFGANPSYYGQFGLKGHEGIDWGTPTGTPITSPFSGIVLRQDYQTDYRNYGKVVVVWDPVQKCAVWFCHLSVEDVITGQKVNKGQVLGKTGATGNVTGPHLHFGLVETDAYGSRLNSNNEYVGFVNANNPNLVKWELASTSPPALTSDQKIDKIRGIIGRGDIGDGEKYTLVKGVVA